MRSFSVTATIHADCVAGEDVVAGELYHVERNDAGGALWTPIARYFSWHPAFVEGINRHWRVDCFFRRHALSPAPIPCGEALVAALVREKLCSEPLWLSVHNSEELEGKAYGEVSEAEQDEGDD